eukprot:2974282-Alexandrium_andersonii.AAC.1
MDLSAYVHFHYLPVAVRREVARMGRLPGPRHAASLMQRIDVATRRHEGLAPASPAALAASLPLAFRRLAPLAW